MSGLSFPLFGMPSFVFQYSLSSAPRRTLTPLLPILSNTFACFPRLFLRFTRLYRAEQ